MNSTLTKAEREKIPLEDFADPANRKFPIDTQAHLDAAAKLYGRADDPEKVKAAIIRIAKRKGLDLPEAWEVPGEPDPDEATDAKDKKAGKSIGAETLISYGGSVKAMGKGKIAGYLVQYSDADNPDLSSMKDFFTANTDFDFEDGDKRSVYFHHGLDSTLKTRKIGRVEMKADDVGVWVEGVLNMRDEYERAIYELAAKGKLGWSSGSPAHLVQRERVEGKNAHEVTHWVISEASLTPNPADHRNEVIAIKSAEVKSTLFADLLREIESESATPAEEIKTADEDNVLTDETADEEGKTARGVVDTLNALPLKSYLLAMRGVMREFERRTDWLEQDAVSTKSGRTLSSSNLATLSDIHDGMTAHISRLKEMIDRHNDAKNAQKPKRITPQTAYMDYLYMQAHNGQITL